MLTLFTVEDNFRNHRDLTYSFNLTYSDKYGRETTIDFTRTGRNLTIIGLATAISIELDHRNMKPNPMYVDDALTALVNYHDVHMSWDDGVQCVKVFAHCVIPYEH